MKQILSLDYQEFVLPASVNLNAILKALSSSKRAKVRYHDGNYYYEVAGTPAIAIKVVDEKFIIDPSKRKAIPEKTGDPV